MSSQPAQKHVLAQKRIIVMGAGIAGLAFTRALDVLWPAEHPKPDVVVYEHSAKALDRAREGYTMGIRTNSGLSALRNIGLLDAAMQSCTTASGGSGQPPTFWTKNWRQLLKFPPPAPSTDGMPAHGVRFVRYMLRQILVDGLPAKTPVHWETGCESVRTREDGKIEIGLSDGSVDVCDLLIAADGANSKIRSCLLPNDELQFAGARCFQGTARFPSGKPNILKNAWGINISGDGVGFLNFPIDSESGAWAVTHRVDQPRERIRGDEAIQRRDEIMGEIRELGQVFDEPFHEIIDATEPVTLSVFNAMQKSPIKHARQLPDANVIFIGDANHAMSPFSGSGANMALMDAVELAKQLSSCTDIREAIDAFDAESAPRSQKAIDWSYWVIRLIHSKGIGFWLLRSFLAVVRLFVRMNS